MKPTRLLLVLSVFALYSCEQSPPADAPDPAEEETTSTEEETAEPVTDVTPREAAELLKEKPGISVLDVRTPEEYAEGHIAEAVNIDFKNSAFSENIADLEKDQAYLVHCRSGSRSAEALKQLETLGLEKIYHLSSGMNGWQEAGLPVEE